MTFLARLTCPALATVMTAGLAAAQEPTFFRIGTGSAGGTYFPIGGTIANGISSPPGSRPCEEGGQCGVPGLIAIAQSTTASVFNNTAVQNGELEAGMASSAPRVSSVSFRMHNLIAMCRRRKAARHYKT